MKLLWYFSKIGQDEGVKILADKDRKTTTFIIYLILATHVQTFIMVFTVLGHNKSFNEVSTVCFFIKSKSAISFSNDVRRLDAERLNYVDISN